MLGMRAESRMSVKRNLSMIPSKIQILLFPFLLIPAQICTLIGCLGLGLGFGRCPCFLQQNLLWFSSCTVHSSVHKTFSKSSSRYWWAHSNLFCLLASLISWQYALPRNVHPSAVLHRKMVLKDMSIPLSSSILWSCVAVDSLSSSIFWSTSFFTVAVILDSRPDPGLLAMDWVCS